MLNSHRLGSSIIAIALMLSTLTPNSFAESYLCVTEESTGFLFENGTWKIANLPLDEKYILRPSRKDDEDYGVHGDGYGLFRIGEKSSTMRCDLEGFYWCKGGGELLFDPAKGRFLKTHSIGYWLGDPEKIAYPHISRGRCEMI